MQLAEVFSKHAISRDDKARRRSNVAKTAANISAAEIEQGVTIERLTSLNVPVFQYSTQITIHGTLPEFDKNARPAGYKSVFRNGNGSIGVRYVAIDGVKKEKLIEISRYVKGVFQPCMDSRGLMLTARFESKADCLDAYNSFPQDVFVGNMRAGAGVWGGYFVLVEVGAIPQAKFEALVKHLYGCTLDEFQLIKAKQDEFEAAEQAKRKAKHNKAMAENKAKQDAAIAEAAAKITLPRLNQIPTAVGSRFVTINYTMQGKARAVLYVITKKVFGKPCAAVTYFDGTNAGWTPGKTDKAVRLEDRMPHLEKRLAQGYIWKI